ncbi:MAG: helix-turn-helix domain-containing protein [Lentisphaeraceae bacterium]|nr:helix-turn-helix domain-containing protein [Lentisphaeraceae bacterium]
MTKVRPYNHTLRAEIKDQGKTIKSAASEIGISRGQLNLIISGDHRPSAQTIESCCQILKKDAYQLDLLDPVLGAKEC